MKTLTSTRLPDADQVQRRRFVAADDSLSSAEQVVAAAGEQTWSLGWSEGREPASAEG